MFRSRKPVNRRTSWLKPRLGFEALEDRVVPATLFADDDLVAGTLLTALPATIQVTNDRDNSNSLTAGDEVSIAVGETGQTANLTFRGTATATPASGDAGVAFGSIQTAIDAASAGDIIRIAKGTYEEALTADVKVTLDGLTNTAADVVIDPATGAAITVTADGVTISDLTVSPAAGSGVVVPAAATAVADLTLRNVAVATADASADVGLDLTGNGSAGSTLTLTDVTVTDGTNGTGAPLTVSGFETVNLTDLDVADVATAADATISLASSAAATLNVTATGNTATTFTASGTSLQLGPTGGTAGAAITLADVDEINLTGTAAADTFAITPTAGTAINVVGGLPTGATGDVLDLDLTGLTGTAVTNLAVAAAGLTGTFTFTNAADVTFSGVESLADAAVVTGTVFNDLDGDGEQDAGEPGVAGVAVQLDLGADGSVDQTATTNAQGNYAFAVLAADTARVRIVLPTGATQTTTDPADLTLTVGTVTADVDFGVQLQTGATGTSTVTGVAFNDANANGTQDAGEVGVNNLVVYLDLDGDGKFDKKDEPATLTRTVNGVAGSFTITSDVVGGTARVRVVEKPGFLENTNSPTVTLTDGATQTVDVGVRADLPPQATPARLFAEGIVVGNAAKLRIRGADGKVEDEIPVGTGEVRVAVGDVTGDGVDDFIVVSGPGRQVTLQVIDGATHKVIETATPFESFIGGAFVTVGDVTRDGIMDIILTPDEGGGPRVVVIRGGDLQTILSFFGIDDAGFRGGARAGVADLNGDGRPDLVVAAGFGGGPRVAVFDGTTISLGQFRKLVNDFFVFDPVLRNGVFATGGDFDGDGFDDLVFGAGPGGGPRVLVVSGQVLQTQGIGAALANPIANFFAGDFNNRGGVHVVARDLDGDGRPELLTGDGTGRRGGVYNDDFGLDFEFESESDDNGSRHGVFVG